MRRRFGAKGASLALSFTFLAALVAGCGSVLPPFDEVDGALPVDDAGMGADISIDDDGLPPDDEEESGAPGDAVADTSGDAGDQDPVDACPGCADVQRETGAPLDAPADARVDADARILDVRATDGDAVSCPAPVNCALAACNGASCGTRGQVCRSGMCVCPGGQTKETTCNDKTDNDCDGLIDCADPDCARLQCGASTNQRCCGTACVNTETDPANCQGCGLACAAGQVCKRITDSAGTRGACTCAGLTSQCPRNPAQVCRAGNGDGQDNICACDAVATGNAGCAEGQVCVDVPAANFCRY